MDLEMLDQVGWGFGYQKACRTDCSLSLSLFTTQGCWIPFIFSHCDLWVLFKIILIIKTLSIPYSKLVCDYLFRIPAPTSDAFCFMTLLILLVSNHSQQGYCKEINYSFLELVFIGLTKFLFNLNLFLK